MTIKSQLDVSEPDAKQEAFVANPERKFPVVEVFGPTIQGEGIDQGIPCHFIRMGGCDYKCSWCDTPFAVLPDLVRRAERLDAEGILQRILALTAGPEWIVISGGNPLLHDLTHVVSLLKYHDFKVSVETQGTVYKRWLETVNRIAVSPKGPSSGMSTEVSTVRSFLSGLSVFSTFLKIVVFSYDDYEYAREVHKAFPGYRMFLSTGNDAGATVGNPGRVDNRSYAGVVMELCNRGRALANKVMVDSDMSDVQVQVQNHVLYWGNERAR